MQIRRTRGCGSRRSHLQVPRPGTAGRDAHTEQEGVARWASRRACGTRATPPMAGMAHGERGGQAPLRPPPLVRRGARRHAWTCRFDRQRAFAVGVATARPERAALAGALARGCAALRASRPLGNLDGQGRAAVLRDQLRNPGGLLADEHVQGELSGLDHVERLFPDGRGAGVGNRRGHGVDQRERRIRCADGAPFFTR
jgi:hypothetical protein